MRLRLVSLLGIAVMVTGCGGGGESPTPPQTKAPVATLSINAVSASLLPGQTSGLTVTLRDASGNTLTDRAIGYSSSNTPVATVSVNGIVTALTAGSTTITATSEGITGSTQVTVTPRTVATVTLSLSTGAEILIGQTTQISSDVRDATNVALTDRTIVYSTGNASVASVNSSGLVTALAAGTSTITGTVEGKTANVVVTVLDGRNIPTFVRPFVDEFPVANFFDHDIPKEFIDTNNNFLTFWGEAHPGLGNMTDGHSGYDFAMPTGIPLFAVAAGTVFIASTTSAPFFCPPLNRDVTDQADVYLEHKLPGGITIQSRYTHVSRIDVTVGQTVTAGQQIGLSGNTGCSTSPHLHFEINRMTQTATGGRTEIDPYGWTGSGQDPWERSAIGAQSIQLWKPGQAPLLFRQLALPLPPTAVSPVVLSRVVFQGVNDAANPNNEFVEVAFDSRVAATGSLDGFVIKGDASGLNFAIPAGLVLNASRPTIRFYTGAGTNTPNAIYMGRPSGVWSNLMSNDCVRLVGPAGGQYRLALGGACP